MCEKGCLYITQTQKIIIIIIIIYISIYKIETFKTLTIFHVSTIFK